MLRNRPPVLNLDLSHRAPRFRLFVSTMWHSALVSRSIKVADTPD